MIYARGDIALLRGRKLTVVGSRRTPAPALKLGARICKELSEAVTIVTGTADGGDGAAIEGALSGSGKVICLLAGGFSAIPQGNLPLLKRVAEQGLLLSPHAYDTPVRAFSYEYRNKLLAAIGEGTLVLGAAEKSGALITAKYAKQMQKLIFALPYAPGAAAGAGCNALLKQGGILTENAADVLEKFGIEKTQETPKATLTADEEKMYEALKDMSEGHLSDLAAKAGIPPYKARAVLSALEVKGLAVSLGGNTFAPIQ
jgi:DNA processing protein